MRKILISIKPEYVEKIFNGTKKYEYRTKLAKRNVGKLVVYCTTPIKKIVGEVDVVKTLTDKPDALWEKTKEFSGSEKDGYDEYFKNHKEANAYVLENPRLFDKPKLLLDYGIKSAPQSFCYIHTNE